MIPFKQFFTEATTKRKFVRDMNMAHSDLYELPTNLPPTIDGHVYLNNNNLSSLVGCPQTVTGAFNCQENVITSLVGGPTQVGGTYRCSFNKLKNLIGAPRVIVRDFWCVVNPLDSLEGAPDHIGGQFYSDMFTDADYREYINKKKYRENALQGSDDEAGLGDILDII